MNIIRYVFKKIIIFGRPRQMTVGHGLSDQLSRHFPVHFTLISRFEPPTLRRSATRASAARATAVLRSYYITLYFKYTTIFQIVKNDIKKHLVHI